MSVRTDDQQGAPDPRAGDEHPVPGFAAALRSEWTKLWSLPATFTMIGALLALTVGVSAVLALFGSAGDLAAAQDEGKFNVIFFSASLGVWLFTFFAATMVAGEFSTKVGGYTFVVTPRRGRILAAKLLIVLGMGAALGIVVALSNVLLTQSALAAGGFRTLDLGDPDLWRAALVFVTLSMIVQASLGAMAAAVLRNAFGALAFVVIGLNAFPVIVAQFLGEAYRSTVPRLMPGAAVESLAGLSAPDSAGYLPVGLGVLVVVGWIVLAWLIASRMLARVDVR